MTEWKKFDRKKLFKSKVTLFAFGGVATLLLCMMLFAGVKLVGGGEEEKTTIAAKEISMKPIKEVVSTEDLWRDAMESKIRDQSKENEDKLNKKIEEIKGEIAKVVDKESQGRESRSLADKITNLTREINEVKARDNLSIKEVVSNKNNNISQYVVNLENAKDSNNYKALKTVDNYIPAGSFAKSILLSGVDAATSLNASGDPDPVLIRIVDHGTLPRKFKSDLKDCHIIGAAYGDLSSERAKIRLEKLSCTEVATAEIVETEVAGYVTGEDGRAGIRGEVVSTEGKLLGNSFLAGTIGGLANGLNPNSQTGQAPIVLSNKMPRESFSRKIEDSFATGASSSMDRLSKYYIERAENLQPVVQIGAGRKIDVIFTEGVFFGNSEIKKAIAKKRDEGIKKKSGAVEVSGSSVIQKLN